MRTVKEIRDGIVSRDLSASVVLEEYLGRIEAKDGEVKAFVEVFTDSARAQAKAIDEARENGEELGVLAGVPVAIKDNMVYRGHGASASSKMLAEYTSAYTSTAVQRLVDAGAIIVGRTNMDEFAMGSSTENSAVAQTANPWNPEHVPGGSSGGAAAAVAADFVPVALGSDTGGSIRQPSALCGVTGFKPTYGRVSRYGLMAMSSSLDQIGPIVHTAEDAAIILSVIEGKDAHDSTTVDISNASLPVLTQDRLDGLKIGVPKEYFVDGTQEGVSSAVKESMAKLEELGAELVDISLPLSPYALAAYYILMPAEVSSNLSRYDGIRYGTRVDGNGLLEVYEKTRGDLFGHEVKRRILLGTYVLSAGYKDAFYKKALAVRAALDEEMEEAFKSVDLIVSPTSPSVAWKFGEKTEDPVAMYLQDVFTVTANIVGIPAVSVPCGLSEGLPVGLQFMGRRMDDVKVLEAAHAFQQATDWHTKQPE
jgi:aspartyl-tRNA(Asn)/glutamyl-tRNA(Gln) amidotransferase subunit A